jgi:phage gpG-like protein
MRNPYQPPSRSPRSSGDVWIIDGAAGWQQFWDQLQDDWETIDLTPAMEAEVGFIEELHNQYFYNAVSPDGDPWAPLAPSTIAAKGHGTILVDSGRLVRSLTSDGPDSIRMVESAKGDWVIVFGTAVEYSIFHDEPAGGRPARPHVGMGEMGLDEFEEHVIDAAIVEWTNAA